ncbi:methylamine dehydrogenase accessory protein MauD [Sphaerotilus montanus]|jgi:methylamine dehydrogenase accessory protein MauD|uniref:Methylamine utilization protein MauD n=1 Tax=Sphaerotilus montanus TaxID=522889 RepID=A0A7Y9QZG9_9BURK|nr:methylamine dehydrogenase accessory protein MauD [Sphaerotilus montanus]NYG32117.1 methylamine dehydrogenase accessory protein MauD [Sphaerotilus montanus]NZD57591.1 methylamine dehydrogenase accessory protein MauD [Sphaerotilus montanus]
MSALTFSVILLWLAVLALAVMLWALSRQVGVLFERVAPMGALVTDSGPAIGSLSPMFELSGIQSERVEIGTPNALPTLVFFLSPTCPVCKKLLPILKALQRAESRTVRIVLASDGEAATHLKFVREHQLEDFPYVLSQELGMTYRVSRLPYGVMLDRRGTVVAKGLVNSREQLDSLLNAHDMGQHSIQHYLGGDRELAASSSSAA